MGTTAAGSFAPVQSRLPLSAAFQVRVPGGVSLWSRCSAGSFLTGLTWVLHVNLALGLGQGQLRGIAGLHQSCLQLTGRLGPLGIAQASSELCRGFKELGPLPSDQARMSPLIPSSCDPQGKGGQQQKSVGASEEVRGGEVFPLVRSVCILFTSVFFL